MNRGVNRETGEDFSPSFQKTAFHCPHCNVVAHQHWSTARSIENSYNYHAPIDSLNVAYCGHCGKYSCWIGKKIIYPSHLTAPLAAEGMPSSVRKYYDEARLIASHSPRSAAALLRLTAKKLCEWLGEDEPNLYRAIGNLQKKGLSETVVQSLDTVRIVGNEGGAHEGQIDLTNEDNAEVVGRLFNLINIIVVKTITEPKYIADTFGSLPEDKRKAVADRDDS